MISEYYMMVESIYSMVYISRINNIAVVTASTEEIAQSFEIVKGSISYTFWNLRVYASHNVYVFFGLSHAHHD